jgi:predicted nucleotidyltransferase
MISKSIIIERLNELKPFLQKEYSVKSIGLFGSFSDNSFSDESHAPFPNA